MGITTKTERPRPGLWDIFTTWFILGIQSFGGGSSTFLLIHRVCISRGWMDEEEFLRDWALAQISPGINLVKLTVLVGHRLRGWPGLIAGVAGMLIPSALVTVLMTAGFAAIRSQPLVQAAMKGILPATIGLSLAMGVQMAVPLFSRARQEGRARVSAHALILAAAALLMALGFVSPIVILLLAGAVTIPVLAVIPSRLEPVAHDEAGQKETQ
jgi:chromate transporter